jgi:hypothetical protein
MLLCLILIDTLSMHDQERRVLFRPPMPFAPSIQV